MDSTPSLMELQTMMEMTMAWENAKEQTPTMDLREEVPHGLERELGQLQILRQSALNSMTHSMINQLAAAVYRSQHLPHKKHLS